MFKEHATINYACQIAGMLGSATGPLPAAEIAQQLGGSASTSYTAKVLSRLTHAGLLRSGVDGYSLVRPVNQLTAADVLRVCHAQLTSGSASTLSDKLTELARDIPLQDLL